MALKQFPLAVLILVIPGLASPGSLRAVEVTGRVRGSGPTSTSRITTIVYAESLEGSQTLKPGHFKMTQQNKTFAPHILAIPAGSKVDFPNADPIFHNVFSQSMPNPFNLGMYRSGQWRSHVFTEPAVYHIFCKIHPQMAGIILVLPTSYIAEADASGKFRLDLPSGHFRITAWTEITSPVTSEITVSNTPTSVPEITLGPATGHLVVRPTN